MLTANNLRQILTQVSLLYGCALIFQSKLHSANAIELNTMSQVYLNYAACN